ncbi:hypothetical protein FQN57_006149 [Myotisia sp. PD_48]|nr:hypothetical protein FQN57_006149 [Myotisia sp. PD_48]
MRSIFYLALSALAAFAAAQTSDNPFSVPADGYDFTANIPTTITWDPTTQGTITIKLQIPGQITPDSGIVLGANLPNSGTFTFVPPARLTGGQEYTIEIIDDDNPDNYNFTPPFTVAGATGTASDITASATSSSRRSSATSSRATTTDEESSTTSAETTATETSSDATTTSTDKPTTTSSEETPTSSDDSQETEIPDPTESNSAMPLTLPGGLLSIVFGIMALL